MSSGMVVVAAGLGTRLGSPTPKALAEVAGRSLLAHVLDRVGRVGADEVVVVHTPGHERAFEAAAGIPVRLVPGGATRSASVRAGVDALRGDHEVVAIHDAARAFMPPAVMRAALDAVRGTVVAAAPGLPVADTLKNVEGDRVLATVDRGRLWGVQTPQVVARVAWDAASAWGREADATDDLAVVEHAVAAGAVTGEVVLVQGSRLGLKITWPEDLVIAAGLAAVGLSGARPAGSGRSGARP